MSEVKRYLIDPQIIANWSDEPGKFDYLRISVVLASDFDAERLRADTAVAEVAALREELEQAKRDRDCEQRACIEANASLKAAEQRNSEQLSLLHMSKELLSTISLHRTMAPNDWCDSFKNEVADRLENLRAVLAKPTESGASE